MGFFPCELCWYQRILMYPLPAILAIGLLRRDPHLVWYVAPLASLGALVAAYHVFLQANPQAELGACFVGSCTVVEWRLWDYLTIPQLSLIAFTVVLLASLAARGLRPPA